MTRAVVNVATTDFYQRGQARLREALHNLEGADDDFDMHLWDGEPPLCPLHRDVPYAMKAYALRLAADEGDVLLLWCDSCIVPVRSMEPLWKRIEKDGYWFAANGFSNYMWCADSAYPDLFPECYHVSDAGDFCLDAAREINRKIQHVVATAFGLNIRHPKGKAFLDEYYRLASETRAFCGPWSNSNYLGDGWPYGENPPRLMPCGPSDVRGHRHDQTAASVIAWRLGFELTQCPEIFAYGRLGDPVDERTILIADGNY
jgi:hypothetical protein